MGYIPGGWSAEEIAIRNIKNGIFPPESGSVGNPFSEWIGAYPNACCMVIALYCGEGDFTRTLHIITMCGLDADCNAGAIMPIIGISRGTDAIPGKYLHPAFETLTTYMRGRYARIATAQLADMTVSAAENALGRPSGTDSITIS